jgi:cytochrome c-type biogenesis protein CcmF
VEFLLERPMQGPNYSGLAGEFRILRRGSEVTQLVSEKRAFKPSGMPTTEVGLHQTLAGDVYVAMGDTSASGARIVRLYYNPLVNLIWLGAVFMFAGGVLSLTDRKYRIGAPKTRARLSEAPAE